MGSSKFWNGFFRPARIRKWVLVNFAMGFFIPARIHKWVVVNFAMGFLDLPVYTNGL